MAYAHLTYPERAFESHRMVRDDQRSAGGFGGSVHQEDWLGLILGMYAQSWLISDLLMLSILLGYAFWSQSLFQNLFYVALPLCNCTTRYRPVTTNKANRPIGVTIYTYRIFLASYHRRPPASGRHPHI